jgi:ferredoxin-NADP reductase
MANMERFELEFLSMSVIGNDYYAFNFKIPKGLHFLEGQYGIFRHVDKEIEGRAMRAFSIASSTFEDELKVAVKITENPSDFKQKMLELKSGDKMLFDGPTGHFTLEKDVDAVYIAGGIGITPIRSILKFCEKTGSKNRNELIYSEAYKVYPFKEELDEMDFVKIHYKNTIENTQEIIDELSLELSNDAVYYVCGSPGFITGIKERLIQNGIRDDRVKFDRFSGY